MSVLIKGMELPKDCPIRIVLYPNGQVVKANAIDYEEFESVSVPPHGRLIDADAKETIVYCEKEENATFIAMILDADAEGKVWALDFYNNHKVSRFSVEHDSD